MTGRMANGRQLRRARLRQAATDTAALFGCTCRRLDIRQRFDPGHIAEVGVGHDDRCPAIVGMVYTLIDDGGRCHR